MSPNSPGPAAFSVVVVNHGTRDYLSACLDSLLGDPECGRVPVVVVDNASRDGSADMVLERYPGIELVALRGNRGYAAGVNAGVERCLSPYVVVLNADTRKLSGRVGALCEFMERRPDVDVVGPRLVGPDGRDQSTCRRFYTLSTVIARRTPVGWLPPGRRVVSEHLMADRDPGQPGEVDWIVGACMVLRQEAWERLGGLDERYFLYLEDTDFCRATRALGHRVCYQPGVVFLHHYQQGSRSVRGGLWHRYHHGASALKYFFKWHLAPPGAAVSGARG